jgi:hypothetical protein
MTPYFQCKPDTADKLGFTSVTTSIKNRNKKTDVTRIALSKAPLVVANDTTTHETIMQS